VERLAAIDVGSNSIHMIVVEPEAGGGYRVLGKEREMVRLGRTGLGRGSLSEAAMRDGLEALVKMTSLAALKGAERVVAVATSAVREAANGEEFLARVRAQTGLKVRLLDGAEEGRLVFRAVREVADLGDGLGAVVDVGGGSTEWIATRAGRLARVVSLPLGSLRCAAKLEGDPPRQRSLLRLRRGARERLEAEVREVPVERLVATSGTAVCCADLVDLWSPRGFRGAAAGLREVKAKDLTRVVEQLAAMPRREIAALPPVGEPRAESLLAGAVLLAELVGHAGADRLLVSDRALREGLVLAALREPLPASKDGGELRRRQVLQLAARAPSVLAHGEQTARLAARLFDLTASLHGLGAREREWLEHAALLHDVGYAIHYRRHHRHSEYLIAHAELDAFDPREIEVIAQLARFHRGAKPRPRHLALRALESWQRRAVRALAALLRLADALDRTHASRVEELYCSIRRRRVTLEVLSRYDVELELADARDRGRLFEEVFERRLTVRQGLAAARKGARR
jgi:exopolyphosphatase / guanosine-5'-triphosphate,3'-diphosphate pyrophosphatase